MSKVKDAVVYEMTAMGAPSHDIVWVNELTPGGQRHICLNEAYIAEHKAPELILLSVQSQTRDRVEKPPITWQYCYCNKCGRLIISEETLIGETV